MMKKRVFIVHGWGGRPEEGWSSWLKNELEARGFEVFAPQMPDTENPRINKWVPKLAEVVGNPDKQTYFVGHSMGCQTIARYLESLSDDVVVGGVVFVAGFFKRLTGMEEDPDEQVIVKHWLDAPLDFEKIKARMGKSVAIFSDDDPYVPLDNQDDFRNKLGSKIIIEHYRGHFTGADDKTIELPIVLKSILEIST